MIGRIVGWAFIAALFVVFVLLFFAPFILSGRISDAEHSATGDKKEAER